MASATLQAHLEAALAQAKVHLPTLATAAHGTAVELARSYLAVFAAVLVGLLTLVAIGTLIYVLPLIPGGRKLDRDTSTLNLNYNDGSVKAAAYRPPAMKIPGSPLSVLRARSAWRALARARGFRSAKALSYAILDDDKVDWGLDQHSLRGVAKGTLPHPKDGDVVRTWDTTFVWDRDCTPLRTLETWRTLSDVSSDAAFDEIQEPAVKALGGPNDSLTRVAIAAKSTVEAPDSRTYWANINARPPPGAGIIPAEWYIQRWRAIDGPNSARAERLAKMTEADFGELADGENFDASRKPWWIKDGEDDSEEIAYERKLLADAQDFHDRHAPPIFLGQLHMGLAGGLSSPRITSVLKATGYLVPDTTDRTTGTEKVETPAARSQISERAYHRLLETGQFSMDIIDNIDALATPLQRAKQLGLSDDEVNKMSAEDLVALGGVGWQSISRVRLLHTSVRYRLGPKGPAAMRARYDLGDGIPVNQEDLMATLTSFTIAPLWSMQRMGLPITVAERNLWIAYWRHVGFYMGCEPRFLTRCFRDMQRAEKIFATISMHHFICVTPAKYLKPLPASTDLSTLPLEGPALPLLHSVSNRPPAHVSFASNLALGRWLIGHNLATALAIPETSLTGKAKLHLSIALTVLPPIFARFYPRRSWGRRLGSNTKKVLNRIFLWQADGVRASFQAKEKGVGSIQGTKVELDPKVGLALKDEHHALMREMAIVLGVGGLAGLVTAPLSVLALQLGLQRALDLAASHLAYLK